MRPEAIPALALGRVWHARTRPVRHAFAYPAFFLRLPLRRLGSGRWPFRWLRRNGRGALALNDADHGDRGPMVAWVDGLLARAGIRDADGELWVHTMPRVFGYLFNPVSFFFAERADGSLRAVVCEVNNTFGERHCYVLAHADGHPLRWGEEMHARKVFHVSPFNEVRGSYRFRFAMREGEAGRAPRFVSLIDYDPADGAPSHMLRTGIEGALQPLSDAALRRVALGWPLHTLGVVARIHWQAFRLWLRRVPVHGKPAAPGSSFSVAGGARNEALQEPRQ